ncbi:glutaryl-CoA dehydrogenase (non-decarboxylating) [Desulfotomaculum arcticum]|uniref:Glutaryl-CoA dehydrogenase (Non-decarboxylating) n=1 Tax=Desulfotruncus arcticus DSM 17038 TaxID=1121424 RepID=A0A1I2VC84_9FIRM|nr:acyl-CoA dehydrogenase family protein [Desulfotruncus arcticus]SFG86974.1 glutaryl-CoA dehydrogenase (non-decarboxylating) [Desulfotomaculum arcticum] [Desulfotruncus arcticus DSM 17038]
MDFGLTEEQQMVQDMARNFAEKEIAPFVEEDEKNHYYRREILKKMGELDLLGWSLPEEYGGNGMGWMEGCIALYEISKVHTSWRLSISGNNWGPAMTINEYGTEEQKQKYIPGLLDGSAVGSFAMTEPNTGSDVASMKTFAEDKGDHWLINGTKTWISGGHTSDTGLLYAVTEKGAGAKGISCFIIDYNNTPGVTRIPINEKVGMWSAPTSELIFENAVVPKENLLGPLNKGFYICMWQLNNTRMGCATGAAALSRACLDGAVQYAQERIQFGKPIGKYQMIQAQIAEMILEDEAAKNLVYRAAWLKDNKLPSQQATSIAKLAGCNAAVHAANLAMKIYGSYGYSNEYPCGRWLRDCKQFETLEGTSNMHQMIIANIELGYAPNR